MAIYRILKISSDLDKYPEAIQDTDNHPEVLPYLNDDFDLFVLNEETNHFWPAMHFFFGEDINRFMTDFEQLEDELFVAAKYIESLNDPDAPKVSNGRIKLTDKDKTFIRLSRSKKL